MTETETVGRLEEYQDKGEKSQISLSALPEGLNNQAQILDKEKDKKTKGGQIKPTEKDVQGNQKQRDESFNPSGSGSNKEPEKIAVDQQIERLMKMIINIEKDHETKMEQMKKEEAKAQIALMEEKMKATSDYPSFKVIHKEHCDFVNQELTTIKSTIANGLKQAQSCSYSYTDKLIQAHKIEILENEQKGKAAENKETELNAYIKHLQNHLRLFPFRSFSQAIFFQLKEKLKLSQPVTSYASLQRMILDTIPDKAEVSSGSTDK